MANAIASTKAGGDKSSGSKLLGWMKRLKTKKSTNKSHAKQTDGRPLTTSGNEEPQNTNSLDQGDQDMHDHADETNPSSTAYLDPIPHQDDQPFLDRDPHAAMESFTSMPSEHHEMQPIQHGQKAESNAPTVNTNSGTTHSDGVISDGHSKAGTNATMAGGMSNFSGGPASIFTSSDHSSRSLSTTLTTIQTQPSNTVIAAQPNVTGQQSHRPNSTLHSSQQSQSSTYFTHQFPITPATAVPTHLQPFMHVPTTYNSATAGNLLSDNASILTLASSSHRPARRNSLDTNASIRAIAPSSVWGGSRESLPLSTLSKDVDGPAASTPPTTSGMAAAGTTRSISGHERASVYSAGGVGVGAPVLSSERNSIYAGKTPGDRFDADKASIKGSMRSGQQAHSRHASMTDKS